MKKVSKLFSLISLCVLMLLMTACGGGGQKFTHGTISGSSYTSGFLGVKVTFGSDWTLYSDGQTAAYNGLSDMSESSIKSKFEQMGTIYDMLAVKPDGSSINIVVQDTKKTGKLKEDTYFTTGLELLKQTLEASGAKVSLKEDSVSFIGKPTRCIKAQMTHQGITVHMIQIPVFKGDYIASITFGALKESDLSSYMAMFKSV